ncbi:hypothetical protein [Nostoc sp.]|uniref:hypothetical protein n=1 Tax=Nostoc sp. TaxID=1180 RepID=UPI002FFA920B
MNRRLYNNQSFVETAIHRVLPEPNRITSTLTNKQAMRSVSFKRNSEPMKSLARTFSTCLAQPVILALTQR